MSKYQVLKGMRDILPGEIEKWQALEAKTRYFFESYGFEEIRTPVMEPTELFTRSIGESSDIVHKQMYTFDDRGGRTVTLRPEMTASVVRAALENGVLRSSKTLRFYYMGPMFRAERPQKGRLRQFHQLGAEILNAKRVEADVELVALSYELLKFLGVPNFRLCHNYLGGDNDREVFAQKLRDFFSGAREKLCEDCHYRIEKNVLRVLDCKNPACQEVIREAPSMELSEASQKEYGEIQDLLARKNIVSERQTRLVRGLDYYTGLVFEMVGGGELGSQDAVAAGGRYDGLISSLGGAAMGAIGFAAGMERVLLAQGENVPTSEHLVYVAALDSKPETEAYLGEILRELYRIGKKVKRDTHLKNLGDHLTKAVKAGIRHAVIIGGEEVAGRTVTVKDLHHKKQEQIKLDQLAVFLHQ